MINPYAATFMIAARQDHNIQSRLTRTPKDASRRRMFRLFGRRPDVDPENP